MFQFLLGKQKLWGPHQTRPMCNFGSHSFLFHYSLFKTLKWYSHLGLRESSPATGNGELATHVWFSLLTFMGVPRMGCRTDEMEILLYVGWEGSLKKGTHLPCKIPDAFYGPIVAHLMGNETLLHHHTCQHLNIWKAKIGTFKPHPRNAPKTVTLKLELQIPHPICSLVPRIVPPNLPLSPRAISWRL